MTLLFIVCLACNSSTPQPPTLPPHLIVTIVSSAIPEQEAIIFRQALAAPVYYLGRPEYPMQVRSALAAERQRYERAATLVLIGKVHQQDDTSRWIAALQGMDPIEAGSIDLGGNLAAFETFENLYAVGQTLVTVLVADDIDSLQMQPLGAAIRVHIEASQVRHRLRELREQTPSGQLPVLSSRHGFRVAIAPGYTWSDTSSVWPQSLEIVAAHPTRILTIFWVDHATAQWATSPDFLLGLWRDALWRLHADRLVEDSVRWIDHENDEMSAQAIWQNTPRIAGGPVQTRFVYDAARQRLYGVQAMVFLPGRDKHRVMREVLALASTFEIRE